MARSSILEAPASLQAILSCIDPVDDDWTAIQIARDLVDANTSLTATEFREAAAYLDRLLGDGVVTDGDLKGLVKRLYVSALFEWSSDARSLLEATRVEIGVWIKRLETKAPSIKSPHQED